MQDPRASDSRAPQRPKDISKDRRVICASTTGAHARWRGQPSSKQFIKILITRSEVYIESNLALALQEQTHDGLGLDPFLIFVTHL